jgi:predicted short-subunit dehydrogenase-like oxidoreductase (DUF2520 family)
VKVGVIGAGGVGQAIARRLSEAGHEVYLVRRPHQVVAGPFTQLTDWRLLPWGRIEVVLLCVRDGQIAPLAAEIGQEGVREVAVGHTAASVGIEALSAFARRGVVYPLQTFSPGAAIKWGTFPIFWEGDEIFFDLAALLAGTSQSVYHADGAERLRLHIGAVFAANFTNALVGIAEKIVGPKWDRHVYLPLLEAVVAKLHTFSPGEAQTGPARRGDKETIQRHLKYLEERWPELAELYRVLTRYIQGQSLQ